MYVPKPFAETRVDVLHELMRAHPLATLVTQTADGLDANHIPFEIVAEPEPFGTLRCHIARANPLWREHKSDTEALAIFRAADAYISPNWYATKSTDGKVVPTWNYAVVHAHGAMQIIEDREWLRELVTRLTNRFETGDGGMESNRRAERFHNRATGRNSRNRNPHNPLNRQIQNKPKPPGKRSDKRCRRIAKRRQRSNGKTCARTE